jgi:glycogen debranching enzyme
MDSIGDVVARNRPLMQWAWSGSSSLVLDNTGQTGDVQIAGFYFRQTRYLSRLNFRVDDEPAFLCSAAQVSPSELEFCYAFPPPSEGAAGTPSRFGLLTRSLDLMLRYAVRPGALDIDLAITNRWNERAEFDLEFLLDADFAGVPEAIAGKRMQQAPVEQTSTDRGLTFHYRHASLPYRTSVELSDSFDWRIMERTVAARVPARHHERILVHLRVVADDYENPISEQDRLIRKETLQKYFDAIASVEAPAETPILSIANRAMRDVRSLALLEGPEEEWLVPGAGVPLYLNPWGRDALTTGWQMGALDQCDTLRAVLAFLAARQGTRIDRETEEEPGRILNREEPMPTARLGIVPFRRFYADFASPFMFIIGLGQLFAWTGDKKTLRRFWPTALRVLEWARRYGDADGDGYLEYAKHSKQGPKHQGWKDSENAVVDSEGRQIEPPIAPAEIQGYWYAALQFMAILSLFMRERRNAKRLWNEAVQLKERFNRDFWMEDQGVVCFGLDSKKQQIRSVVSNAGHCLASGIVSDDKIPRLVQRLFEADMFSGWGIRTLSTNNPAYNPIDYHLGSVWTVENGTILLGLRRYGFDDRTIQLIRALYDLALMWPAGRIPETVGGYGRDEHGHPGAYPQANAPQAWNQSIWAIVMQTLLGLQPAASFRLLGVDPILPEWLPEVTLKNLRVGDAVVSIRFWRDGRGRSHYRVVRKEGTLRVIRQAPINAMTVHWWNRLASLVRH